MHLGHEDVVLVVDETGFLKKGAKSAGVQWSIDSSIVIVIHFLPDQEITGSTLGHLGLCVGLGCVRFGGLVLAPFAPARCEF